MVGVDQPQMDLSLLGSITAIVSLSLMTLGASLCRLDVRTLIPLNSIIMRLAGC